MTRIYQAGALAAHTTLTLDPAASHHVARVLRLEVGEPLTVFNGQGGEYQASIREIHKKSVTVQVGEWIAREVESALDITLAQGISRGEKMDYTIQKAVELGVRCIIPLLTERCNVKLEPLRAEKRLQHWQSVIISACEQSGRNRVPDILPPEKLEHWLSRVEADHCLVLSPEGSHSLRSLAIENPARIVLMAGPEGGFSAREVALAKARAFLPIRLGPRILRTETAALAAIAALQGCYGDMG